MKTVFFVLAAVICGLAGRFMCMIAAMFVSTGTFLTLDIGIVAKGYIGAVGSGAVGTVAGIIAGLTLYLPLIGRAESGPFFRGLFKWFLKGLMSGGIFITIVAVYLGSAVDPEIVINFLPMGVVFMLPVWTFLGLAIYFPYRFTRQGV